VPAVNRYRYSFFSYELINLQAGRAKPFDVKIKLEFKMEDYWYGFTLYEHNNNKPFFKKLYDQDLTEKDIEQITDTICEALIEQIDSRL
jgi:hypothetical protein